MRVLRYTHNNYPLLIVQADRDIPTLVLNEIVWAVDGNLVGAFWWFLNLLDIEKLDQAHFIRRSVGR